MSKKKSAIFQIVICLFISGVVFLAAILNAYTFENSSIDAMGENKAAILSNLKSGLEYGLKYGRQLENYYDIEEIFKKIDKYCDAEDSFILDKDLNLLYGNNIPEGLTAEIDPGAEDLGDKFLWTENGFQNIVIAIEGRGERAGYIGITASTESMKDFSSIYMKKMYLYAFFVALVGIVLFEFMFHTSRHRYKEKSLRSLVLRTIMLVSVISLIPNYFLLKEGYTALSTDVANNLIMQSTDDMDELIANGVMYSDIKDVEVYFDNIAASSDQISTLQLTDASEEGYVSRKLSKDANGEERYLTASLDVGFIARKVTGSMINIVVTTITALMMAIEILLFLTGLLVGKERDRRKQIDNTKRETIEDFALVRGLSFSFSAFRYMAVAFMAIVLAEIYEPTYIFGIEIPYEILMSFPLSGQVFISMITSYLSGNLIAKIGWKKTTLGGMIIMMMGTLVSSFAKAPIPFILAQMLIGTGLGFAKMGIDIYSVLVASEKDMSKFTSNANAGIIVGYSSSAAIGALIANIFGYSGAYMVMTGIGVVVFVMIARFGMNVAPMNADEEDEAQPTGEVPEKTGLEIQFPSYIMFIIIPYFFIMMFVDYFFPVYANDAGVTTDVIGYVILIYGILTAYVGTPLCPKLTKRFKAPFLMPAILLVLAVSLLAFSLAGFVIAAALIVMLIGITDGVMPSVQFMYVYDLPISKRMGFSKVLGIEGFFSNLIGAIAPVIFGVVMMYGTGGLTVVAIVIIACAILFMILNGSLKITGKKITASILALALILGSLFGNNAIKAKAEGDSTDKIRIGYSQAGDYYEFDYQIYEIAMALLENGEIRGDKLYSLSLGDSAKKVWDALCNSESRYYEFVNEAYFDVSTYAYSSLDEDQALKKLAQEIEDKNVEMMITMGTTAGLMVKDSCEVPYMNFIASDPVSSGITQTPLLSGSDRAWAHVSTGVEQKALAVMDDIFSPKKIGIVYNNEDPEAYVYSGAASLDEFAKAGGREVVTEFVVDEFGETDEEYQEYKQQMLNAHQKLADAGIDLYILTTSYLELDDFEEVLKPFVDKGIPVFSLNSTEDVRCGALAAVEMFDYKNIGRFAVDTLDKYFHGESLGNLSQEYVTSPFLVLNIDTMRKTGIKMPLDTLISASKIYGKYEGD